MGFTASDQRHPGWKVKRAAVVLPILTTSTWVFGGVLVSSGESNDFIANPGMNVPPGTGVNARITVRLLYPCPPS